MLDVSSPQQVSGRIDTCGDLHYGSFMVFSKMYLHMEGRKFMKKREGQIYSPVTLHKDTNTIQEMEPWGPNQPKELS